MVTGEEPPITRGGVVFLDQGQFLLTNAKWTMAFDVPIKQFVQQAERLEKEIARLMGTMKHMRPEDFYMLPLLSNETQTLKSTVRKLGKEIRSFEWVIPSRHTKRGLVDAGGKVLKFLFGVAEEDDIRQINSKIDTIFEGVSKSIHLQDVQATYLNHTIIKMNEIQISVNRLNTVINSLDLASKNITVALLYSHNLHLLELAYDGLWREWSQLKTAVLMLGQGSLSQYFIPPEKLNAILHKLRDQLTQGTQLATSTKDNLAHATYSWLTTTPTEWNNTLRCFSKFLLKQPKIILIYYRL